MKFVTFTFILSLLVLSSCKQKRSSISTSRNNRQARMFSLFNIVHFPNNPCTIQRENLTQTGTCLGENQCIEQGGRSIGDCASGFGVCCVVTLTSCSAAITKNATYIQSPGFPSTSSGLSCTYTFIKPSKNICQLRLDFDVFESLSPANTTGTCGDTLTITKPSGVNPPEVCGILTGQHMYIEAIPNEDTIATLDVDISSGLYRIHSSFIECNSLTRAPYGCLQYFTGIAGNIKSYNHQGGRLLRNQYYSSCFRQELGMCGIEFREVTTRNISTAIDSFSLAHNTVVGSVPASNNADCKKTYIKIPSTNPIHIGIHCGAVLSEQDRQTVPGSVLGDIVPFVLETFTDDTNIPDLVGYNLDFTQKPCT